MTRGPSSQFSELSAGLVERSQSVDGSRYLVALDPTGFAECWVPINAVLAEAACVTRVA
jgi:hypothetical protein